MPTRSPLDDILYTFSADGDCWSGHEAVEGSIILARSGVGKTSAAGKELIVAMLEAGMGGLVLCAKGSDADDWKRYFRLAGRSADDLIDFSPTSGHCFDPLTYLWSRPGGQMLENIIDLIRVLIEIANPHTGNNSNRFFDLAANQLARNAIVLLSLAKQPISITTISRLIDSLPTQPGEHESPEYQADSELTRVLGIVKQRREASELSESEWEDFAHALHFALVKWPGMYPETRTSIHATWDGLSDQLNFGALRTAFSSAKCTFIPEQAEVGKVILCNWPALSMGETGRIIGCFLKLTFQLAWTKRVVTEDSPIVFFVSDEAALYMLPNGRDARFQAVCRGARVAALFLQQSIVGIAEACGEHDPGARTFSWLGNISTQIFLANNEIQTNTYASNLVGKEFRLLGNYSMTADNPHVGASEHLDHTILPHEFTTLRKADSQNPVAEAVVYKGGSRFRANGLNYLLTTFTR